MALQSSGPISFADINAEFARGAGTPLSMSQLYRGGAIVPNATVNQNIPTSGTIGLGQFYGATRRVPINITISSNQTNYVLNTAKAAGYVAGISDIVLTINSGVYVSSNSTGVYALDVDTSWAAGDTVQIVNNGFIVGMGGAGGTEATAGGFGGTALRALTGVSILNAGTIAGGGGGGGGGGIGRLSYYEDRSRTAVGGGGGGGGGRSSAAANAPAGTGGTGATAGTLSSAGVGANGTTGDGGGSRTATGGQGGNGASWGATGSSGLSGSPAFGGPGAGGSGGAAVSGNANITWLATGTRLGAINT